MEILNLLLAMCISNTRTPLGHPFCSGIKLSKLAAITTNEQGNEIIDASGALDKCSLQLLQLAVYHDSESAPWNLDNNWEDLKPVDCTKIFQDEIDELDGNRTASLWAKDRRYLVSPINGILKYRCLGNQERQNPQIPFEKASLVLSDVYFTVSEAQYNDGIKLLEALSSYKTRVEVSHLRPIVPVMEDTHAWWLYAMLASLRQKKLCYWFSWERMKHHCQLRRLYIQIYSAFLQQTSNVDIYAMRKIERILDSKVILLWRLLAHAKLELVGAMERSSWSFGWRSTSSGLSINELLSCLPQNMRQIEVDVSVGKAAARISGTEIVYGNFEHLNLTTETPFQSVRWDVSLKCHDSSSPEAQLSQC
ncbi:hypothetical protein KSP40_PGU017420 [Platanthera guangdongensis]|uniref:Uncharacterized protein n=1 Tax=Platanthera guangdongensis TaxID=2320717 RepID=A0ABR2LLD5_9ASPA